MAKTIHTDKAPAAIGPYVQGKLSAISCLRVGRFLCLLKQEKSLGQLLKSRPSRLLKKLFQPFWKPLEQILTM